HIGGNPPSPRRDRSPGCPGAAGAGSGLAHAPDPLMLLRPHREEVGLITYYLGRIMWIMAATGLVPAAVAVAQAEWQPLGWFLTMSGVAAVLGALTEPFRPRTSRAMRWGDGMVIVALTWLLVPLVGSIPFVLSGHFGDGLDAVFEA